MLIIFNPVANNNITNRRQILDLFFKTRNIGELGLFQQEIFAHNRWNRQFATEEHMRKYFLQRDIVLFCLRGGWGGMDCHSFDIGIFVNFAYLN